MKTANLTIVAILLTTGLGAALAQGQQAPAAPAAPAQGQVPAGGAGGRQGGGGGARGPAMPGLTLTTPAFPDGGEIPAKYTGLADPNPMTPKLEWSNVPAGTVTFAIILHDPDTSMQKKYEDILHWMAFNIPGTARELAEGLPTTATLPDGTVQLKRRGNAAVYGYMGPGAPAVGPFHHYTFELIALDTKLDLTSDATRADVMAAMEGHILGKGVLVGRFHR